MLPTPVLFLLLKLLQASNPPPQTITSTLSTPIQKRCLVNKSAKPSLASPTTFSTSEGERLVTNTAAGATDTSVSMSIQNPGSYPATGCQSSSNLIIFCYLFITAAATQELVHTISTFPTISSQPSLLITLHKTFLFLKTMLYYIMVL